MPNSQTSPSLDPLIPFDGSDASMLASGAMPMPDPNDPLEMEGFREIFDDIWGESRMSPTKRARKPRPSRKAA